MQHGIPGDFDNDGKPELFTVYGDDITALRADFLDPINPGVQNTPSKGLLVFSEPFRGPKQSWCKKSHFCPEITI